MKATQRKEKFITILNELLHKNEGIKAKLAQNLDINPSTLSRWFSGQVDPISIDLINFLKLAEIANLSPDQLANSIGIDVRSEEEVLDRFKTIIKDLLFTQSLEQLGTKLGVTHGAIGGWLSEQRKVNPQKIPIGTIASIAIEKGWSVERLLVYLGLKQLKSEKNNLLFKAQSSVNQLSLKDRVKLLAWLSDRVQQEIIQEETLAFSCNRRVGLVIEKEDNLIASNYSSNLVRHLQLEPANIAIATIQELPDPIDSDILIFDISSPDSPSIALIEQISFNGDIVVFVPESFDEKIRAGLEDKVTDVVVKPIDWQKLKDKAYFS